MQSNFLIWKCAMTNVILIESAWYSKVLLASRPSISDLREGKEETKSDDFICSEMYEGLLVQTCVKFSNIFFYT